MTYPTWWQFVLLALAAFRVTRLIGWDDLTIGLRRAATGLGDEEHKQWAYVIDHQREIDYDPWDVPLDLAPWDALAYRLKQASGSENVPPIVRAEDTPIPPVTPLRYYLSKLIRCPWCAGFWVALAFAVGWGGWTDAWLSGVALALPLSAAVGLTAKTLDP